MKKIIKKIIKENDFDWVNDEQFNWINDIPEIKIGDFFTEEDIAFDDDEDYRVNVIPGKVIYTLTYDEVNEYIFGGRGDDDYILGTLIRFGYFGYGHEDEVDSDEINYLGSYFSDEQVELFQDLLTKLRIQVNLSELIENQTLSELNELLDTPFLSGRDNWVEFTDMALYEIGTALDNSRQTSTVNEWNNILEENNIDLQRTSSMNFGDSYRITVPLPFQNESDLSEILVVGIGEILEGDWAQIYYETWDTGEAEEPINEQINKLLEFFKEKVIEFENDIRDYEENGGFDQGFNQNQLKMDFKEIYKRKLNHLLKEDGFDWVDDIRGVEIGDQFTEKDVVYEEDENFKVNVLEDKIVYSLEYDEWNEKVNTGYDDWYLNCLVTGEPENYSDEVDEDEFTYVGGYINKVNQSRLKNILSQILPSEDDVSQLFTTAIEEDFNELEPYIGVDFYSGRHDWEETSEECLSEIGMTVERNRWKNLRNEFNTKLKKDNVTLEYSHYWNTVSMSVPFPYGPKKINNVSEILNVLDNNVFSMEWSDIYLEDFDIGDIGKEINEFMDSFLTQLEKTLNDE